MSGTITVHETAPEPLVSGLRILGSGRTVPLLEWNGRRKWFGFTIGRNESNDIRLPDPAVSERHAVIDIVAAAPGSLPPAFEIRDRGSKNGIRVSRFGPRGPFGRAPVIRLQVGQHLLLGSMILAVVGWASMYPSMSRSDIEYVMLVRDCYGSDWPAAWYLGLSVERLRQVLARRST